MNERLRKVSRKEAIGQIVLIGMGSVALALFADLATSRDSNTGETKIGRFLRVLGELNQDPNRRLIK